MIENVELNMINISEIDLDKVYLHYTNKNNLVSIYKNGLQPKIGKNAKVIEKTKKVFFSVGDKGALVTMDTWLKWLIAIPKNELIYYIGANLIKIKFVQILYRMITGNHKSEKKCKWSYNKLKKILDNSVYLVLNLEENIDFKYNDIDEVKKYSKYPKDFIKNVYAYNSNPLDEQMEYWNMHTISNKIINPQKIQVLRLNNETSASEILKYLIENNLDYVKENCELLYKYYQYIYFQK